MKLIKSKGNMYDWVSNTLSYLKGECPHGCHYCYVQAMSKRFAEVRANRTGPVTFDETSLEQNLGQGRTIFIENMNDLFADSVPGDWIGRVLEHCKKYPLNTYVFQTKNPGRYRFWIEHLPHGALLGTTIESNYHHREMGEAPPPVNRYLAMADLPKRLRKFVTIEPILKLDIKTLAGWIALIRPEFVNIGADSKGGNLPEPTGPEVQELIKRLADAGIQIKQKTNLARLLNEASRNA
jgi:hypothetical protein